METKKKRYYRPLFEYGTNITNKLFEAARAHGKEPLEYLRSLIEKDYDLLQGEREENNGEAIA